MFTQTWFWLLFAAIVLINLLLNTRGSKSTLKDIGGYCALSCVIFCAIGLFKAEHWWYPIVGFTMAFVASGIVEGIIKCFEKLNFALVLIGMVACPVLCVMMYIVGY